MSSSGDSNLATTLIESYVQSYDDAESATESVDALEAWLDSLDSYASTYQDAQRTASETGFSEHFAEAVTSPDAISELSSPEEVQAEGQRASEWVHLYREYARVAALLASNTDAPRGRELTAIDGIGEQRAEALSEVGITDGSDLSTVALSTLVDVGDIGEITASKLQARAKGTIHSIHIEDLPGVGSETARALRSTGFHTLESIAESSEAELAEVPGIGSAKASHLKATVEFVLGDGVPESHRQRVTEQYRPSTTNLQRAKSGLGQLRAWVQAHERYFDLRLKAYQSGSKLPSPAGQTVPFSVADAAPWTCTTVGDAQAALDELDTVITSLGQYQTARNRLEAVSAESSDGAASEILQAVETQLWTAELPDELPAISARLATAERHLDLGREVINAMEQYPDYPFDSLVEALISSVESESRAEDSVAELRTLVESSVQVLEYLQTVDPTHPAIEAEQWQRTIRTALEERFPDSVIPVQKQVQRLKSSRWTRTQLNDLDWAEFEVIIAALFDARGYETEVTAGTKDLGVDVWAEAGDERIAIQAKHFTDGNTVGRETLQKLSSTLAKGDADRAIVVTSSSFASTAEQYAADFPQGLELMDGDDLLRALSESGVPPPV